MRIATLYSRSVIYIKLLRRNILQEEYFNEILLFPHINLINKTKYSIKTQLNINTISKT
jgi:hypothetical protein